MTNRRPRLAFISPVFLFPNDAGGKIRSTNILRGLKGGRFHVVLVGPATTQQQAQWSNEITAVCDEMVAWAPTPVRPLWRRAFDLAGPLPVNVANDKTAAGVAAVWQLARREDIDLIVFDFVHSAVLWPAEVTCASVCFTHNVETEIFARHALQASNPFTRWMWRSQHRKMRQFEAHALRRFSAVVAVSQRDAQFFAVQYGVSRVRSIPTGVDLDFFSWAMPPPVDAGSPPTVVFTGSMNWRPNIDGVRHFLNAIWPTVLKARPGVQLVVVGRDAPDDLVAQASRMENVKFTGFVDDVRPYVHCAHAFVIPLLVGGGTRIKAFEAMAMGCPVVSTSIGIEGLDVVAGQHFLRSDDPAGFAESIVALLDDPGLRSRISLQARQLVEQHFAHTVAAGVFEQICVDALSPAMPRALLNHAV